MLASASFGGLGRTMCGGSCRHKAVVTRPTTGQTVIQPASRRSTASSAFLVLGSRRGRDNKNAEKQVFFGLTLGDAAKWAGLFASTYGVVYAIVNASVSPLYNQLTFIEELVEVKFNASNNFATNTKELLEVKLEYLKEGQERLEKGLERLEKGQERLEKVQDRLKESQDGRSVF